MCGRGADWSMSRRQVRDGFTLFEGFFGELIMTFILMFVMYHVAVYDNGKNADPSNDSSANKMANDLGFPHNCCSLLKDKWPEPGQRSEKAAARPDQSYYPRERMTVWTAKVHQWTAICLGFTVAASVDWLTGEGAGLLRLLSPAPDHGVLDQSDALDRGSGSGQCSRDA